MEQAKNDQQGITFLNEEELEGVSGGQANQYSAWKNNGDSTVTQTQYQWNPLDQNWEAQQVNKMSVDGKKVPTQVKDPGAYYRDGNIK